MFFDILNKAKKEDIENVLKTLWNVEVKGGHFNLDYLCNKSKFSHKKIDKILSILEQAGLFVNETKQLTDEGRAYGMQIVRGHRLYEKYLSKKTWYAPEDWHERACHIEHHLDKEQQEALARSLGNPLFDPHGDPIPQEGMELHSVEGKAIDLFKEGDVLRVVKIDDWPKDIFLKIKALGLLPKSVFRLLKIDDKGVDILYEGEKFRIDSSILNNISVEICTSASEIKEVDKIHRLTCLQQGQTARIVGLSRSCTGLVRRRLLDLGFVRNSDVSIDLTSPMKNPIAYLIRGTVIALRRDQAGYILIDNVKKIK